MKKLWLTCGLLLTMAVCGNNRVLAGTPESSDTIFMRFEKYNYLERYSGSWAGKGRVDFSVDLGKDVVFAEKSSKYEYPIDIVRARVEVKTADGGIAIWMAYGTGKCDYYPGYDEPRGTAVLSVSFPDSLVGKDFTVKFYDYEYGQSWSSASPDYSKVEFYRVSGINRISVDDSSNLVEISIRGSGFCAALTSLKCCNNQLISLDVNGCSALRTLLCYNNYQLTSLDVSGCTALKELNCSGNQLESLDVSSCRALEELRCVGNQLESLDVSRALEVLWCGGNQLESLDVSGCTALKELECSYNQLESLDVSGCTALKGLGCSYNQLESLDVSGCTALGSLSCSTNRLTSLELGLYHKLGYLRCSDNQLTFLDLYDISNMELCVISGNHISGLLYTGEPKMVFVAFGDNCFPLHKCHELSKWVDVSQNQYWLHGGSQYVPVTLGINEHYDLHTDMELDGVKTTLRVTRKGGGYLDPKLYSVENDWLSFAEKGEYTVEMTNPKVRDHVMEDHEYVPSSTALVSVFLDVRVGMPDEPRPDDPNDPNNPNDPSNPDNPNDPNDPNSPNNPDNPTTANEAGGTLTTAALQVYPNPATDVLHVELLPSAASESLQVVRVLSQSGHLCHSFGSGFDNLSVADLPAGLYFIEAETTTGTVLRQKFVKR